jgi:hypothetical protein
MELTDELFTLAKKPPSQENLELIKKKLGDVAEYVETLSGLVEEAEVTANEYEGSLDDTQYSVVDREGLWNDLCTNLGDLAGELS